MKTQIKSVMIVLMLSVTSISQAATYGGGSGTAEDPYQIWTPQQMNTIGLNPDDWGSCFKLMADIDMSIYTGTQYNIIGNDTTPFTGTFDGNNQVIHNLTYTTSDSVWYVGLFGCTNNAMIGNLGMKNVSISSGGSIIGGLVGRHEYGTLTNCYVIGSVNGAATVGGLVGYSPSGMLTSCYATASVGGTSYSVGGLVGVNWAGCLIDSCYATGSVSGEFRVGGLVGENAGQLTTCYATGSVSGNYWNGGLVGQNYSSPITFCYSTGLVGGTTVVGGLVGYNESGTLTACFWDTQTSGRTDGVGNQDPDPSGAVGKTTAEMQTRSTFTSAGWDFTVIDGDPFDWWMLVKSYPHLYWEPYYGGGSGTAEDPYQIWTAEQMNTIGLNAPDWNKHFKLMADIDMSIYTGTQYNIIGNSDTKFTGALNGNEHAIRNLAYTTGNAVDCIGLLGRIENAFIQNLSLENVSLSSGGKNIGGLVGWNDSSSLSACYMSGSVNGIGHVGGLVGRNDSGSLTACHAAGSVSGTNAIGGLAGGNYSGSLENCYATGSVSGTGNYVGGLIGYNTKGKLTACYAAGSVAETGTRVGGLAGWNSADSTVTACFWDTQSSGTSNGVGGGSSSGITGKTMAEMQSLSTFTSAGWDFANETANGNSNFWRMCENEVDYPRLNWESMKGDFTCPDGVSSEDLDYYADHWLMNGCWINNNYCGGADMDYSGAVDLADWVIFAAQWLKEGDGVPMDMVYIPGGTFEMGDSFSEGDSNEQPVHSVTLSPFYMGKYEITNGQYCDFLNSALSGGLITVDSNLVYQADSGTTYLYCDTYQSTIDSQINWDGSTFTVRTKSGRSMTNDPMVQVSWYGAVAYCSWRSQQEGKQLCYNLTTWERDTSKKGYHLPTEAQWEYAARGGLSGRRFPWGDTIVHDQANYNSTTSYSYDVSSTRGYHPTWNDGVSPYTSPVGNFAANGFGLYDMAGNIFEWCNDWYDSSYYSSSPSSNPTGPITGTYRVLRGGGWNYFAGDCRVAVRGIIYPSTRSYYLGFRISLD